MRTTIDTMDPGFVNQMYKVLSGLSQSNPDLLSAVVTAVAQDKGLLKQFQKGMGHIPVSGPQKGWDKLMYTPIKFNKIKDPKTGKWRSLSDQEKRDKVWQIINRDSYLGDLSLGLGTAFSNLANAQSKAVDKSADLSASNEQRARFGATASDRAAAAVSPFARARANTWQAIGSILSNRFWQQAADERAAMLQAMQDAMYNNMGMSGQYADARRKLFDQYSMDGGTQS